MACSRENCSADSTGKCLEGFDPLESCPYRDKKEISTERTGPEDTELIVPFYSGEALTEEEANWVARTDCTKVVILIGPPDSGKTTILTSLFDAFLKAPFGNYLFGGSKSLIGFERRCHDGRTASGRSAAHTHHTPTKDSMDFLHLKLVAPDSSIIGPVNLLISDVSGERFRDLQDSSSSVINMAALRRANNISLVIDGQKIVNNGERHAAKSEARMLIRAIIEQSVLSADCRIDVIFSKWDLIADSEIESQCKQFIDSIKDMITTIVANKFVLQFTEIAARPENTRLHFAFGLPTLLRSWLGQFNQLSEPQLFSPAIQSNSTGAARYSEAIIKSQQLERDYAISRF